MQIQPELFGPILNNRRDVDSPFQSRNRKTGHVVETPTLTSMKEISGSVISCKNYGLGFFYVDEIVLIDYLDCGATITGDYYTQLIPKAHKAIMRRGTVTLRQHASSQESRCNGCH